MKINYKLVVLFVCFSFLGYAQQESAFKKGEWIKFRVHYGFLNAGYCTLEVNEVVEAGTEVYHVTGKGWTTGFAGLFFKVDDNYQSFINKETMQPHKFHRRVNEGGYIINRDVYFDQVNHVALIKDNHKKTENTVVARRVQDMVSTFYYLRNQNTDSLKIGESLELDMFFDSKVFPFKLKYIGKQTLNTKFGKINCLMFKPLVEVERIFKEKEALTIWISDDKNKVPVRIKANLAVGSIKADLDEYKGLSFPFIPL